MILNRNPLQLLRKRRRPSQATRQQGHPITLVSGGMTEGQLDQLPKLFGGVMIKRQNPDRTELVIWRRDE